MGYDVKNNEKMVVKKQAGYSEDSDYTSDFNYPVGQHANSSASQFRNAAGQLATPQRSLETSRENSYETDEQAPPYRQPSYEQHGHHLSPPGQREGGRRHRKRQEDYYNSKNSGHYQETEQEADPLYYNSRPRGYKEQRQRSYYEDQEQYSDSAYGKERYAKTSYKDGSYKRSRHKEANYGDNRYWSYKDKRYKDKHLKDNGYEYGDGEAEYEEKYEYDYSGAECVDCYNQSQSMESEYYDTTAYDQDRYNQGYDDKYDSSYQRNAYSKDSSRTSDGPKSKYSKPYQEDTFYSKPERHKPAEPDTEVTVRRPSLERQNTLYDDQYYYYDSAGQPYNESSYDQSGYTDDYYNKTTDYTHQDNRQWDSGGRGGESQSYYYPTTTEGDQYTEDVTRPQRARAYQTTSRDTQDDEEEVYYSPRQSYEDENYQPGGDYSTTSGAARRKQFSQQNSGSRGSRSGSRDGYDYSSYPYDFPPPSKSGTKKLPEIPVQQTQQQPPTQRKTPSLPPTPAKPPEQGTKDDYQYYTPATPAQKTNGYNENYNYAYESTENLAGEAATTVPPPSYVTDSYNFYYNQHQPQQQHQEETPSLTVPATKAPTEELSRRDTLKKQFQR
ncbi:unnamed protein product [Bemisia tabaci]|uniref:Uncharacterized protein n=1 Tax=Bemisia tabaci TaxID=7038 RepID=A0A9P0AE23_BEMTA|nr:unnamed protein product [Bemisia tabaci]